MQARSRFLPEELGFLLPFEISFAEQQVIIEHAQRLGEPRHPLPQRGEPAIWYSWDVRLTKEPIPTSVKYWHRMDLDKTWYWTEGTEPVREALSRIEFLYRHLTMVSVYLTMPGKTIPMHKEPVAGAMYRGGAYYAEARPDAPISFVHGDQRLLNLRIPLSSVENDNGNPVLEIEDALWRYKVGRHYFALNEYDVRHGALPCNHLRGVVHISGELDIHALDKLPHVPVPIELAE